MDSQKSKNPELPRCGKYFPRRGTSGFFARIFACLPPLADCPISQRGQPMNFRKRGAAPRGFSGIFIDSKIHRLTPCRKEYVEPAHFHCQSSLSQRVGGGCPSNSASSPANAISANAWAQSARGCRGAWIRIMRSCTSISTWFVSPHCSMNGFGMRTPRELPIGMRVVFMAESYPLCRYMSRSVFALRSKRGPPIHPIRNRGIRGGHSLRPAQKLANDGQKQSELFEVVAVGGVGQDRHFAARQGVAIGHERVGRGFVVLAADEQDGRFDFAQPRQQVRPLEAARQRSAAWRRSSQSLHTHSGLRRIATG
jgi:hypothetical protein